MQDVSTSKTGKHGHAKCNFVAIDIFTDKKYEDIIPSTHNANVPFVKRTEWLLTNITEDDFVALVDELGNEREDVKLPEVPADLGRRIRADFLAEKVLNISVMSAMGHDQIIDYKVEEEKR